MLSARKEKAWRGPFNAAGDAATLPPPSAQRARAAGANARDGRGTSALTDPGISHDVRTLIVERIDSVVQLELLLLLQANAGRAWSAAEVAQELRIEPSWATGQLGELAARGLLAPAADRSGSFAYAPASAQLGDAVAQLAKDYAQRRVTVITLIFSKPVDKLRSFADAFRLRKDNPNG